MMMFCAPFVLSLSKRVPPRNPPFDKLRANGSGVGL